MITTEKQSAAEMLRSEIERSMTRATDELAETVGNIANGMAVAAAAEMFRANDSGRTPWIDGAAYAFGTMLGHLLATMPLPHMRQFVEAIAADVAPTDEEAREQEIRHKLEAFDAFHAQTGNAGRLP